MQLIRGTCIGILTVIIDGSSLIQVYRHFKAKPQIIRRLFLSRTAGVGRVTFHRVKQKTQEKLLRDRSRTLAKIQT